MAPNPRRIASPADVADKLAGMVEADRQAAVAAAGRVRPGGLKGEPWHTIDAPGEPEFDGNWQQSLVGDVNPVGFYRDETGNVHLRGFAEDASATGPTHNIFVLPPDYRPKFLQYHAALVKVGSAGLAAGGYIVIGPNGQVIGTVASGDLRQVCFDNHLFRVAEYG